LTDHTGTNRNKFESIKTTTKLTFMSDKFHRNHSRCFRVGKKGRRQTYVYCLR